jgi:hypothetical protein
MRSCFDRGCERTAPPSSAPVRATVAVARGALLSLALVLASGSLAAASTDRAAGGAATHHTAAGDLEASWDVAPVVVDGRSLFEVPRLLGRPAPERAAAIAERIELAAGTATVEPTSLRTEQMELGIAIVAGDRRLMLVTEEDARTAGLPPATLAAAYREAIRDAIVRYRAARAPERVAAGIRASILVAFALLATLVVLWYAVRGADRALARKLEGRVQDVGIQSFRIVSANAIRKSLRYLVRACGTLAALGAAYAALWYALGEFADTRVAAARLAELALQPLARLGHAALSAIPGMLFLLVLALGTRWLLRLLRLLFAQVHRRAIQFEGFEAEWALPDLPHRARDRGRVRGGRRLPVHPGSSSAAFKGISVFLGMMFSLGSTS